MITIIEQLAELKLKRTACIHRSFLEFFRNLSLKLQEQSKLMSLHFDFGLTNFLNEGFYDLVMIIPT